MNVNMKGWKSPQKSWYSKQHLWRLFTLCQFWKGGYLPQFRVYILKTTFVEKYLDFVCLHFPSQSGYMIDIKFVWNFAHFFHYPLDFGNYYFENHWMYTLLWFVIVKVNKGHNIVHKWFTLLDVIVIGSWYQSLIVIGSCDNRIFLSLVIINEMWLISAGLTLKKVILIVS